MRMEPKYKIRRRVAVLSVGTLAALGGYATGPNTTEADARQLRGVLRPSTKVTSRQCSPAVTPCHMYKPAFVKSNGDLVVDCNHPNVWCDDEGS
jgi:hypothetical protein